ncbi:hypothetical protein FN976_01960 [Caenimonas sedimenti]|uniref:Uncharacterized protein n=1 Tax=Caenimonas sedimenti TaxID=2596921 RepID=A0A562ZXZ5_9BURK|nr:hypothetical protein [Caenimonas sedimenti]TWO73024.1 hypothetical protein FN976_01960 [Caenimonas sedimenti]
MSVLPPARKCRQQLLHVLRTVVISGPVRATAMRTALTTGEFRRYIEEIHAYWPQPRGWEASAFTKFKALLKQGDRYEQRGRKLPAVGPRAFQRHQLLREAERSYEAALETIRELVSANPALAHLVDRDLTEDVCLESEGMVRPSGSSHEYAMPISTTEQRSRAAVQRRHIEASLAKLAAHEDVSELPRAGGVAM